MKKEQDEEHRTKRILLNKYKDTFEQRKQEQRASTHNTRTHNKKQAKHKEQCQDYESIQIQEEKQEARSNSSNAEEQRTHPKRAIKNK